MSRFARDLVTGGAACEPSDGAGPSGQTQNPIARVADALLGDRGRGAREQQMREAREHGARDRLESTRDATTRARARGASGETDDAYGQADARSRSRERRTGSDWRKKACSGEQN